MISISLCMIVKNEELVLGRCLDSVKNLMDEIIIVDTGSTDKTKEIASLYTNKIYDFPWINDFAAARNFSFSKATKDYIMWLDADDVLLYEDNKKLQQLKENLDTSVDMVIMRYNMSFDKDDKPIYSFNRERLLKRSCNYTWSGQVHETIDYFGNIIYSSIGVSHKKIKETPIDRNLKIYEYILSQGKKLQPREEFYYGRELMYNNRFDDAIEVLTFFINSSFGFVENKISACKDLAFCYFSQNKNLEGLLSLFRSFQFDEPRAEICCDIGYYFLEKEEYTKAIFWYKLALTRTFDEKSSAFQIIDCYNYIPYLQLCVCYDKIGNYQKAFEYNELAGSIKPYDESYLYNKEYFNNFFSTF